ncbi:MAG: hypothetical protein IK080_00455 [Clostridia bacterium]|nr:hypothetical protein [Clostridia bacterium]
MKKILALLVSLALIVGCASVVAYADPIVRPRIYSITVNGPVEHGTVTVDSSAEAGTTVTIVAQPASNYLLDSLEVKKSNGTAVTVSPVTTPILIKYNYTFTMPSSAVTVTAVFVPEAAAHWDGEEGIIKDGVHYLQPGDSITPTFYLDRNPGFISATATLDYDENVFDVSDEWILSIPDAVFFTFPVIGGGTPDPNIKNIVRQDATTDYTGTGSAFWFFGTIKSGVGPGTYSLTCTFTAKHADNTNYSFTVTQDYVVTVTGLSMRIDNAAGDMLNHGEINACPGDTLELAVYVEDNPCLHDITTDVTWNSACFDERDASEASSGANPAEWEVFPNTNYSKTAITDGWEVANGLQTPQVFIGYYTQRTGVLYTFTVHVAEDAPYAFHVPINLTKVSATRATSSNGGTSQNMLVTKVANAYINIVPETVSVRLDNYNNDMLTNGKIQAYPGQTLTLYTVVEENPGFSACDIWAFPLSGDYGISHVGHENMGSAYGTVGNLYATMLHVKGEQEVLGTLNSSTNVTYEFIDDDSPWISHHRVYNNNMYTGLHSGTGRMFYDKIQLGDNNFAPGNYTIALRADFKIVDPNSKTGYTSMPFTVGYAEIEVLPEISKDDWNVIRGSSLYLDGTIGLNVYLAPQPDIAASGYVNVKGPNNFDQTYQLSSMTPSANGYRFSVPIYSPQGYEEVELRLYNENGEIQPIFYNAARQVDDVFIDSVYDYTVRIANSTSSAITATMKTLASRVQLYMGVSYMHFNGMAYTPGMSFPALAGISASTVSGFAMTNVGTLPEGVMFGGMSLKLMDNIALQLYFDVTGVPMPTVTIDGQPATVYNNGTFRYVVIPNIGSALLDQPHTIVVNGTYTITVSALSYAYRVLSMYPDGTYETSNPFLGDLVKALYLYNAAANDYFGV